MKVLQSRLVAFLPALVFIGNELIRTYIRPVYGRRQYGILSDILGWLPNFLAAFGFMALGVAVIRLLQAAGQQGGRAQRAWVLFALTVVCLVGLLQHEFTQKGSGLYYDVHDVYATLAGALLGAVYYYWLLLRPARH